MSWKKLVLIVVSAALVLGGVALALGPKPVLVDIASVTSGKFVQTVDEDGRTRARDRYVVSSPVTGTLLRPSLRPGDRVQQNQRLATIVPAVPPLLDTRSRHELVARLAATRAATGRASANVEAAKVAHDFDRIELERTRKLAATGAVAPAELERAELEFRASQKELEAARLSAQVSRHEVAVAKAALDRSARDGKGEQWEVTSPITGVVLRVLQEQEGVVPVGKGLFEVADPTALEVVVDLVTTEAVRVQPGSGVAIEGWGGPELTGRVRLVEPAAVTKVSALGVEEQRTNVIIDLLSPAAKWKDLGDGYRVETRITVYRSDHALTVPIGALFRTGESWGVFVLEGSTVRQRKVELGPRGTRRAVVTAGLTRGEQVVLHPGDDLEEGVQVEARPSKPGS